MKSDELHKVEPSTLLRFAGATKVFSWPLVALGGGCIGPTVLASERSG